MNQFMTGTAPKSARSRADGQMAAHPTQIFEACQGAGRPDLAAALIIARATMREVDVQLAAEGAPAPTAAPAAPSPAATRDNSVVTAAPAAAHAGAAQPAPAAIDVRKVYAAHRAQLAKRAATLRARS